MFNPPARGHDVVTTKSEPVLFSYGERVYDHVIALNPVASKISYVILTFCRFWRNIESRPTARFCE